mmetsp:Transcript_26675/g.73570  ORF Transcript_26675/g.73570 Transcript_26675/m.73570 type:complete len:240 (+) Transcript_26675:15-734(+)
MMRQRSATTAAYSFSCSFQRIITNYKNVPTLRRFSDARRIRVEGSIPNGGKGVVLGQYAQVQRTFSLQDVQTFAQVIGDDNPLHQQWSFGTGDSFPPLAVTNHPLTRLTTTKTTTTTTTTTTTNIPVVHGMLVGSLFSCIFGTLTPGAIYLNQTLHFQTPVYVNDTILGRTTITRIRDWTKRQQSQSQRSGVVLTCRTEVLHASDDSDDKSNRSKPFVTGEANVWIPTGYPLPKEEEEE